MSRCDENRPVIFYGAGEEARVRLPQWLEKGLVPVCFSDIDEKKHFTKFEPAENDSGKIERYDILPLAVATARYPDYLLYITLGNDKLRDVTDWLIEQGIPQERVRYANPVEWRKGCRFLGKEMYVGDGGTSFGFCCVANSPRFQLSGNFPDDLATYRENSARIIRDWREGGNTSCDGCVHLHMGFFEIAPSLSVVAINGMGGDYCNAQCIYCPQFPKPSAERMDICHQRVMGVLQSLANVYDPRKLTIIFGSGEFTVSSYRDEAVDFLKNTGMKALILSNGFVYNEGVAELLRRKQAVVAVTFDTTDPLKYARIKGVDCLGKVKNNIEKYASTGGGIVIKWIVLDGINDTREDVIGIVDFAAKIGASVCLTGNAHESSKRLSADSLGACFFFLRRAKEKGTPIFLVVRENFHPADLEEIDRCLAELAAEA